MATANDGTLHRQIRTLYPVGKIPERSDGQLISRWSRATGLALVIGACGFGSLLLANCVASGHEHGQLERMSVAQSATVTVKPGKCHPVVTERGIAAYADTVSIYCQLTGESTINWILPDMSIVKQGDLVGQLESQRLNEEYEMQYGIVALAERAYLSARARRERGDLRVRSRSGGGRAFEAGDLESGKGKEIQARRPDRKMQSLRSSRRSNRSCHWREIPEFFPNCQRRNNS